MSISEGLDLVTGQGVICCARKYWLILWCQSEGSRWFKASLADRVTLSTKPLAARWKGAVVVWRMPSLARNSWKGAEVNWGPLSVTKVSSNMWVANSPSRTWTMASVVVECIKLECVSTTIRNVCPWNGLARSIWTRAHEALEASHSLVGAARGADLDCWHRGQVATPLFDLVVHPGPPNITVAQGLHSYDTGVGLMEMGQNLASQFTGITTLFPHRRQPFCVDSPCCLWW